jgi:hypothetical protein
MLIINAIWNYSLLRLELELGDTTATEFIIIFNSLYLIFVDYSYISHFLLFPRLV